MIQLFLFKEKDNVFRYSNLRIVIKEKQTDKLYAIKKLLAKKNY